MLIAGTGNYVGPFTAPSTTTGTATVISGNQGPGITLSGSNNTITANYFGYANRTIAGPFEPGLAPNSGMSVLVVGSPTGNSVSGNFGPP